MLAFNVTPESDDVCPFTSSATVINSSTCRCQRAGCARGHRNWNWIHCAPAGDAYRQSACTHCLLFKHLHDFCCGIFTYSAWCRQRAWLNDRHVERTTQRWPCCHINANKCFQNIYHSLLVQPAPDGSQSQDSCANSNVPRQITWR